MANLQESLDLLARQLNGSDNEAKITSLQAVEAELRHAVGDAEQDIDDLENAVTQLKLALKSNNARVASTALSCSQALFLRLAQRSLTQASDIIKVLAHAVDAVLPMPGVMALSGDNREATRELAGRTLLQAAKAVASLEAEDIQSKLDRLVKEQGFASKNARTREQMLHYTTRVRSEYPSLPLRQWVPLLVATLEDSDSTVRDTARTSVIAIFTLPSVGNAARSDLKKEMLKKGVRKGTSDAVLRGVFEAPSGSASTGAPSVASSTGDVDVPTNDNFTTQDETVPKADPAMQSDKKVESSERKIRQAKDQSHEAVLAKLEAVAAAAPAPPEDPNAGVVHVVYIASSKDLEQEFQAMAPHFEGKENEHNWNEREKCIFRMRGMLKGEVHKQFQEPFVQNLKLVQDGIMKATASLRTTLAAAACHLVIGLAEALHHGLDALYDTWATALLRLASLTKKTIAQLSQDALSAMIKHCSYHAKLLHLLSGNLDQQKNVQARVYTAGHFKLFLETQAVAHKENIEASNALEILQKAIHSLLLDANAAVRDHARTSYWHFNEIWPAKASQLFDSLDANVRKQLEKADPKKASAGITAGIRSVSGSSQMSTGGRPSVRALISSRRAAQSSTSSQDQPQTVPGSVAPPSIARRQYDVHSSPPRQARPATTPSSTPNSRPVSFHGRSPTATTPSPKSSLLHAQNRTLVHERVSSYTTNDQGASSSRPSPLAQGGHIDSKSNGRLIEPNSGTPSIVKTGSDLPSANCEIREPSLIADVTSTLPLDSPPLFSAASVPLPGDTPLGEESIDFSRYRSPNKQERPTDRRASASSEESRDLDRTMDLSFTSQDALEVDEAVKGKADQAQQTAHRFLELTEPDDVVAAPLQTPASAGPVTYSHKNGHFHPTSGVEAQRSIKPVNTPLAQRMSDIHLRDSPVVEALQGLPQNGKQSTTNGSWWQLKSDMEVSKAVPYENLPSLVLEAVARVETGRTSADELVRLAAFSANQAATAAIWQEERSFSRLLAATCTLLRREDRIDIAESALILLKNLIDHQYDLLGGREIEIIQLLLDLRRSDNKGVAAAAQVVAQQLALERMQPLYALFCLRTGLHEHLKRHTRPDGALDPETASSYGMVLSFFGSLFSQLPSEVLEEELVRVSDLIRTALNNTYFTHLRQGCVSALAKAHVVLQDDDRLFAILGGLTKGQMNLCTYFFAREAISR